jgi:hypothetical protein
LRDEDEGDGGDVGVGLGAQVHLPGQLAAGVGGCGGQDGVCFDAAETEPGEQFLENH